MPLAQLEVQRVMCGGDLQRPGTELGLDRLISHDGQCASDDRQHRLAPHQVAIARVLGVHRHAGVAQHRLGPGSGYRNVLVSPSLGIANVVQLAVQLLVLHLQVREGGRATRAPVDDALSAVHKALVVHVHKSRPDSAHRAWVQGKPEPRPVAGGAQALELLIDGVAILLYPLPDPVQEGLSAQLMAAGAFPGQLLLYHPLGSYARMVLAWEPEGRLAQHTVPAHQHVLYGDCKGMSQVELPCDIGRRHYHHERLLARVHGRGEVASTLPEFVNAALNIPGVIGPWDTVAAVFRHSSAL